MELRKILADLVAIPSVNPMGRNVAGPDYLENDIGQYVLHFLKRRKVDVHVEQVFPRRPNIVGHIEVGSRETLLLEAHLDTVPVDNMTIRPFNPVIRGGRLFGRGSCDTKSSLAAILHAVQRVLARGKRLRRNVIIAAVCDEEYGLNGTRALLKHRLKINYAIVGEPTGLTIISSHKGVMRWRMTVDGKSAHSAYPHMGINAIFHMARLLQRLKGHADELASGRKHPVLGSATLSVGMIAGGQSVNTVPSECTIEIDRRTLPYEKPRAVLSRVKKIIPSTIRCTLKKPHLVVPSLDDRLNHPAVVLLWDALRKSGRKPVVKGARYVTDASLYGAKGIPAVVFGPGNIDQAHAEVEYVRLSEVADAAQVYDALLTAS